MDKYRKLSDAELLILLRSGDESAFTEIYTRFSAVLYLHARHMLHNRDDARDVIQEVFTSIWNRRLDLDLTTSLNGYLYRSVRNKVLNLIRTEKRDSVYLTEIGEALERGEYSTDEQVNYNELKRLIELEVSLLPARMREVFELSRNQQLSHAEIAALLDISDLTVKKQINKAIHILRERLDIPATLLFLYLNQK
ncbi:RNA polymerase sigma factor [Pedobacter psychroterrae]|uniref:RNA polymerase sigma-70 factor n=1 Tax=Pedobacter psychroterrae TaxID=2530453 RepID=A0A4R0NE78_9SPHI|nr:RNA polymerase sigma-70 factor [Pedobacter psychroterrae]TCC96854.1 RNA polymerase sigma-70 factor [Pedobacter psychroterrae]